MRVFFVIIPSLMLSLPAFSGELETESYFELDAVIGEFNDSETGPEPENAQIELSIGGDIDYLLDNGVKITTSATLRALTENPSRPGFAGSVIACPPTEINCPSINGEGVRGGFSRLATLGAPKDYDGRAGLELAYIAIDGGWGELVIGRDQGVAQRFYEGGPTIFTLARNSSPVFNPSGISIARARNDISSTAEKLSLVSPRILGLRAGLSYTPNASVRRLELDTSYHVPGVIEPDLDQAWEAGLQGSHYFRGNGLRLRTSLTWSSAKVDSPYYENVDTISAGLEVERRDEYRFGVSYLHSDNGGIGDYSNLAGGMTFFYKDWEIGVSGDVSEDKASDLQAWSTTIGASRELFDDIGVSFGYRFAETELQTMINGQIPDVNRDGVLLEVRIRK